MNIKIFIIIIVALAGVGGGMLWIKETNTKETVFVPIQQPKEEKIDQDRIESKKREKAFVDHLMGETKELPK